MSTHRPEPGKDASQEEIEAEIAAARDRLADDVAALADKANVPKHVKARVDETRSNIGDAAHAAQRQAQAKASALPWPIQIALPAAAVIGLILLIIARRRGSDRGRPA